MRETKEFERGTMFNERSEDVLTDQNNNLINWVNDNDIIKDSEDTTTYGNPFPDLQPGTSKGNRFFEHEKSLGFGFRRSHGPGKPGGGNIPFPFKRKK